MRACVGCSHPSNLFTAASKWIAAMESDILKIALWSALFISIAVLMYGFNNKFVIYYDNNDFVWSMTIVPVTFAIMMISRSLDSPVLSGVFFYLSAIAFVALSVRCTYFSWKYNSFLSTPARAIVAISRTITSIVFCVLLINYISRLFDKNASRREVQIASLVLGILSFILYRFINGEAVYEKIHVQQNSKMNPA
jgi:hypothetical protein